VSLRYLPEYAENLAPAILFKAVSSIQATAASLGLSKPNP
jgi:hypothetical protein